MNDPVPTRIHVEMVAGRARFTELRAGTYLRPRPLHIDGPVARIALVGTYATLLAWDDLQINVEVGTGVWLELVEPSGTVAYHAQGGSAQWSAKVAVAAGGRLVWRAAPFVITAGANVHRSTHVSLAADARALMSETLVFGRTYEAGGGPLRSTMRVDHDGRPLLLEDLDLRDAAHRDAPGIMGTNRTMATVFLLGARPEQLSGRHETRFAGAGAMARVLALNAHTAEDIVDDAWQRWRREFADPEAHRIQQQAQLHDEQSKEGEQPDSSRVSAAATQGSASPSTSARQAGHRPTIGKWVKRAS